MMSKRLTMDHEKQEYVDAFKAFDKNGDGVISASELRQVMQHMGERLNDKEIDDMIKEADMDGDGQINYVGTCHVIYTLQTKGSEHPQTYFPVIRPIMFMNF